VQGCRQESRTSGPLTACLGNNMQHVVENLILEDLADKGACT